jgi:hypothetical protein
MPINSTHQPIFHRSSNKKKSSINVEVHEFKNLFSKLKKEVIGSATSTLGKSIVQLYIGGALHT